MKLIFFSLTGIFLFTGCLAQQSSSYIVNVNSISRPAISQAAKGKKYFLAHAVRAGVFGQRRRSYVDSR